MDTKEQQLVSRCNCLHQWFSTRRKQEIWIVVSSLYLPLSFLASIAHSFVSSSPQTALATVQCVRTLLEKSTCFMDLFLVNILWWWRNFLMREIFCFVFCISINLHDGLVELGEMELLILTLDSAVARFAARLQDFSANACFSLRSLLFTDRWCWMMVLYSIAWTSSSLAYFSRSLQKLGVCNLRSPNSLNVLCKMIKKTRSSLDILVFLYGRLAIQHNWAMERLQAGIMCCTWICWEWWVWTGEKFERLILSQSSSEGVYIQAHVFFSLKNESVLLFFQFCNPILMGGDFILELLHLFSDTIKYRCSEWALPSFGVPFNWEQIGSDSLTGASNGDSVICRWFPDFYRWAIFSGATTWESPCCRHLHLLMNKFTVSLQIWWLHLSQIWEDARKFCSG